MVIRKITCFEKYVEIETKYGTFTLDRLITAKYRSFPKFTYKIETDNKETPKDITKCRLEITYLYSDDRSRKLCINFPIMKIYMEGEEKQ